MVASVIEVEIINQQQLLSVDESRLESAVRQVLAGEGLERATVSVAVVDDARIRELNLRFLDHDYATDVLSFTLDQAEGRMTDGEIVVSAETAREAAARLGWRPEDELLLYVVHGALHLAGYDDRGEDDSAQMRDREARWLRQFNVDSLPAGRV